MILTDVCDSKVTPTLNSYSNTSRAVIDIGSNSVRLVIYCVEGRSIWPVFNEKVLAGLGIDLWKTGYLNKTGKTEALLALRRFRAILEFYRLDKLYCVATAACRSALDGKDFIDEIKSITGFDVRILTGQEEAFYSAKGVICAHHHPDGLMGDLGGSSLELKTLSHFEQNDGITLALGPFALGAPHELNIESTSQKIKETIEPVKDQFQHDVFHAVGGAWRNLAIIWLKTKNYPIKIVQQFELPARELSDITRFVSTQSASSLEKIEGIPKRRVETIGYSALVLQILIESLSLKTVIFSAYGLREGLIYEDMSKTDKDTDPLLSGCLSLARRSSSHQGFGEELAIWALSYFDSLKEDKAKLPNNRLIQASAFLADVGAFFHPDHRADLAFEYVLRTPVSGQNHFERVFLASSIYTRYCGDPYAKDIELINKILSENGQSLATHLGLVLRLGCDLSAKSPLLLKHSRLKVVNQDLILDVDKDWRDILLGEQTKKRLRALSNFNKLSLKMSF